LTEWSTAQQFDVHWRDELYQSLLVEAISPNMFTSNRGAENVEVQTPSVLRPPISKITGLKGCGVQAATLLHNLTHKIAMVKRAKAKISEKQLSLRKQLWPKVDDDDLWLRKFHTGFTTIPRTMPLFFVIMDSLSVGKPVSAVYFELWCRTFDECFVTLNKDKEMAFHSGFSGQRAVQTWTDRVKILHRLGFINVKPGPSGDLSYAVILNPYKVIKEMIKEGGPAIAEALMTGLIQRANEIGANDLE